MNHTYKGGPQLAFDEGKLRLRLEGRIVLGRLMNEILREFCEEFNDSLLRGEVLTIGGSAAETQRYFEAAARKALGDGS